jgi:hypothetical protein
MRHMRFFQNTRTTRYRAYVVPADSRDGDYTRETIYCFEALNFCGVERTLDALFGGRWQYLSEA